MMNKIKEIHAIYTKDESIWINFDGEVPRTGEIIHIKESLFTVVSIKWFFIPWKDEGGHSFNRETTTYAQARVLIEENNTNYFDKDLSDD